MRFFALFENNESSKRRRRRTMARLRPIMRQKAPFAFWFGHKIFRIEFSIWKFHQKNRKMSCDLLNWIWLNSTVYYVLQILIQSWCIKMTKWQIVNNQERIYAMLYWRKFQTVYDNNFEILLTHSKNNESLRILMETNLFQKSFRWQKSHF